MRKVILFVLPMLLSLVLLVGCQTSQATGGQEDLKIEVSYRSKCCLIKIFANPARGYNYDFYLRIPGNKNPIFNRLLVSPTNSGSGNDDIKYHENSVINDMTGGWKGAVAEGLNAVLLMPVFPRPYENWKYLTHMLDRDSMLLRHSKMARLDEQLIAMINEGRSYLSSISIDTSDKVFIYGFSACSKFSNRFTLMHPNIVKAAAYGGISGAPILPISEYKGQKLIYPVGIYDISEISGTPFDDSAYRNVAQYIFMGENDKNDAVPYRDSYSDIERYLIYSVLGADISKRWDKAMELLPLYTGRVQMVTYKDIGHTVPRYVVNDMVNFFKANNQDEFAAIIPTNAIGN